MMNMKSNNVASQDELRSISDIINLIYTNLSATIIIVTVHVWGDTLKF